jgi:hypothetical protein
MRGRGVANIRDARAAPAGRRWHAPAHHHQTVKPSRREGRWRRRTCCD